MTRVFVKARAAWLLSLFYLCLAACSNSTSNSELLSELSVSGRTMGTYYNVKVVAPEKSLPTEQRLLEWSDSLFQGINQSMSTYIPSSELSQINQQHSDDWQQVSAALFEVLALSQKISELSSGAFDVTVGPLVNVWGFGPEERQDKTPSEATINRLLEKVGFEHIELDATLSRMKKPRGVSIDLSAIAKGYAADRLAQLLVEKGFENVLVEVGGELSVRGVSVRKSPWRIAIESPNYNVMSASKAPARTVLIGSGGMATSGDYRNYYEVDGERFSHTIDPNTGRPITHKLASVTVIADTCAEADALATAFNVLGPELAKTIADKHEIAAFFIVREGDGFKTDFSPAFAAYLDQNSLR